MLTVPTGANFHSLVSISVSWTTVECLQMSGNTGKCRGPDRNFVKKNVSNLEIFTHEWTLSSDSQVQIWIKLSLSTKTQSKAAEPSFTSDIVFVYAVISATPSRHSKEPIPKAGKVTGYNCLETYWYGSVPKDFGKTSVTFSHSTLLEKLSAHRLERCALGCAKNSLEG